MKAKEQRVRKLKSAEPERAAEPPQRALRLVVAALILKTDSTGDEVLICQRRADQPMALKWEFPGGKIEQGETPEEALRRELNEELGIEAVIGTAVTRVRHNYRNGGAVDLQFFIVREFKGELDNRIFQQMQWSKFSDLPEFDFLAADLGLIHDLAAGKLRMPQTAMETAG